MYTAASLSSPFYTFQIVNNVLQLIWFIFASGFEAVWQVHINVLFSHSSQSSGVAVKTVDRFEQDVDLDEDDAQQMSTPGEKRKREGNIQQLIT